MDKAAAPKRNITIDIRLAEKDQNLTVIKDVLRKSDRVEDVKSKSDENDDTKVDETIGSESRKGESLEDTLKVVSTNKQDMNMITSSSELNGVPLIQATHDVNLVNNIRYIFCESQLDAWTSYTALTFYS